MITAKLAAKFAAGVVLAHIGGVAGRIVVPATSFAGPSTAVVSAGFAPTIDFG